jgi:peptidoglycan/LPS O-acetylase OafA/YrhL
MAVISTSAPAAVNRKSLGHVTALDGLRGIALLLVVVYHFAPDVLPAGFLGVDVFFVLSGFLIASLALGEHDRHATVSTAGFYARRARRLLPAAVVAIVSIVVLSAVLQPEAARGQVRGEGVASLLYVSNWWQMAHGGSYQAAFGAESPLSHFWSLSVEEQFYVVFPLLLLGLIALVRRRGGSTRTLALLTLVLSSVGAVGSAVWMNLLYDPTVDPSSVYLATGTRAQALLLGVAGACVWWLWSDHLSGVLTTRTLVVAASAAFAFLVWAAVESDFRSGWLYRFGFFVVGLAALLVVLSIGTSRTLLARAFEFPVLVTAGLLSYSIYLWHWPVRVFVTTARTSLDGWALFAVRCALTLTAALLSFFLVERPFRTATRRPRIAAFAVSGLAVALAAVWFVSRPVPAPAMQYSSAQAPMVVAPDPAAGAADPVAPPTGPIKVLWLGDSVAWSLGGGTLDAPTLDGYNSPFDPARVVIWNKADHSCPLVNAPSRSFGVVREKTGWCVEKDTQWPLFEAQFHPEVVVWSGALFDTTDYLVDGQWVVFGTPEWDAVYDSWLEKVRPLATADGAVFVIIGQPDPLPNTMQTTQESLLPENAWRFGHVRDLQQRFAARHPDDVRYIDLQPVVCPLDDCLSRRADGTGQRADGLHFNPASAAEVAGPISDGLEQAVGRSR